jgi:hypothetical protein
LIHPRTTTLIVRARSSRVWLLRKCNRHLRSLCPIASRALSLMVVVWSL